MQSSEFTPANELETELLRAQQGLIELGDFIEVLLRSSVFVPILDRHGIGGFQASTQAQPMVLHDEISQTPVMVLFTSPERAKAFVSEHPGYEGGLLVDFSWVLERVGSGVMLSLNPNWSVGMDMEADTVSQLKQRLAD